MKHSINTIVLLLAIAACTATSEISELTVRETHSYAVFDWFSYEGKDPVYESLTLGDDEFYNPILAGFYPDPSIAGANGDYYLVTSSFAYFPGIPIFHSKDLVNWTQVGHVLDRPSQLNLDSLGLSRGVFAPAIEYHDGIYYVLNTLVDAGGNFMVTATDPAGDWSDPIWLPEVEGIDPSIFFDDDGKIYILNNADPEGESLYQGHKAIWIQEYDASAQKIINKKMIIDGGVDISQQPIWIEAPHLVKINEEYILLAAEGGTGPEHSEVVFKSNSPWGPYVPYENNPILTQRHLDKARPFPVEYAGHADIVETQNGEWWAVFLGVRPYEWQYFNTGRETFLLPVEWIDGWPVILQGDEPVPYKVKKPDLPQQPSAGIPINGNFVLFEDFDEPALDDYWIFIRTPREEWFNLNSNPGSVSIKSRPHPLSGRGQPSFIGRRQQHAYAEVSTAMQFEPKSVGDIAGLTAFQGEHFYYLIALGLDESNQKTVFLEKRNGQESNEASEIIASVPVQLPEGQNLYLKIEAKGKFYDFYYATEEGAWQLLMANADGTILSTEVAGGFVGTVFGLYAYSEN